MVRRNYTRLEMIFGKLAKNHQKQTLLTQAAEADLSRNESKEQSTQIFRLLKALQDDLTFIEKRSIGAYQGLVMNRDQVRLLMKNVGRIPPEDWRLIRQAKREAEKIKEYLRRKRKVVTDDRHVETERKYQEEMYLNVRKGWKPI